MPKGAKWEKLGIPQKMKPPANNVGPMAQLVSCDSRVASISPGKTTIHSVSKRTKEHRPECFNSKGSRQTKKEHGKDTRWQIGKDRRADWALPLPASAPFGKGCRAD